VRVDREEPHPDLACDHSSLNGSGNTPALKVSEGREPCSLSTLARGSGSGGRGSPLAGASSDCPTTEGASQLGWAEAFTNQFVPNRSTHMPKVSPQGAFSKGIVMVPFLLSRSQ
jgi:hypothetical protein